MCIVGYIVAIIYMENYMYLEKKKRISVCAPSLNSNHFFISYLRFITVKLYYTFVRKFLNNAIVMHLL